ncbi:MAG: RelA/SpoT family protein, partial [Clostridia bacterium]|nr:RelA/SpoT family protein [Clostridia bacterium]
LVELGIKGDVNVRPKHFYSIYKKMKKLDIDIDQIYDLLAVRIIVDSEKDCYSLLGTVHTLWKPMPGRFKDYIAMPKANNYQSLHTTVVTQFNETFEIQIRTYEMHKIAEYGVAAHWKYKEGTIGVETDLDNKVRWLREVMDAEKDITGATEFMDAIKINVFDDQVFVFTPKGDVYDLPEGSTPVDLAYKIHSEIGNHCVGAKVNKKMVTLSTKLQTGDIVELLTQSNGKPSLDWLKYVRTSGARSRIRQYFKKEQHEENVKRGKEMLEREVKRRGFSMAEVIQVTSFDKVLQRLSVTSEEDLYATIGFGGLTTNQVVLRLIEGVKRDKPLDIIEVPVSKPDNRQTSKNGILVQGNANFSVRMARCCSPVPGDEIVGYISRGRGVSIHRKDCSNVSSMEAERLLEASWDSANKGQFNATLRILSENRGGLLANITMCIANAHIEITSAAVSTDTNNDTAQIDITVLTKSSEEIDELIRKLNTISGIISIKR